MARGNAALEKKLAELEIEIGRLLEHPSSHIRDDINGQVGFNQTARKISFIRNLLTAEMASHSGGRPEYLNHMAMRLSILEKTFVNRAIPARLSIVDEMHVNRVDLRDGNGAVNKSSDTSTSSSFTESRVVDEEEFVEEDNVNQEAKEFGASEETETILPQVSEVTERGTVESKEEETEDVEEEEEERSREERKDGEQEVEVTKDESRKNGKHGEMAGECTVEVTEDEKEGREGKIGKNEDEKVGEKKQEAEIVEEKKVVVQEDAEERDRNRARKTVGDLEVEATEEKGGWKQEGEIVRKRRFEAEEDGGSERKKGAEMGEDEKEIERNQERQMAGESAVDAEKDGRKEEREMRGTPIRGRERKPKAGMAVMQKIVVKDDDKGIEWKQRSYSLRNCMAMGCAAAAGFTIALIGVAVANIFWVEEVVYLVPT